MTFGRGRAARSAGLNVSHDVLAYGARGDGTTDDTPALQRAIDAAAPGDTVLFPAPSDHYRVTEPLQVGTLLTFAGSRTRIRQVAGDSPLFAVSLDPARGSELGDLALSSGRGS